MINKNIITVATVLTSCLYATPRSILKIIQFALEANMMSEREHDPQTEFNATYANSLITVNYGSFNSLLGSPVYQSVTNSNLARIIDVSLKSSNLLIAHGTLELTALALSVASSSILYYWEGQRIIYFNDIIQHGVNIENNCHDIDETTALKIIESAIYNNHSPAWYVLPEAIAGILNTGLALYGLHNNNRQPMPTAIDTETLPTTPNSLHIFTTPDTPSSLSSASATESPQHIHQPLTHSKSAGNVINFMKQTDIEVKPTKHTMEMSTGTETIINAIPDYYTFIAPSHLVHYSGLTLQLFRNWSYFTSVKARFDLQNQITYDVLNKMVNNCLSADFLQAHYDCNNLEGDVLELILAGKCKSLDADDMVNDYEL